jgi:dTMP kinase
VFKKVNPKFYVIEGIDGCGKTTQTNLLKTYLENKGKTVKILDFPAYHTKFGQLVRNYLNGEYGSLENVPPECASLLYAIDRYQFKNQNLQDYSNYDYILSNRYIESNIGFQGAKFQTKEERLEFIKWLLNVESRNLQSDKIIFLDLDKNESRKNLNKRDNRIGRKNINDIHESDLNYMEQVRQTYLEYSSLEENQSKWVVLNCMDNQTNTIKSIQQIHNMIINNLDI